MFSAAFSFCLELISLPGSPSHAHEAGFWWLLTDLFGKALRWPRVTNKDKGLLFRGVPWQGHREVCCRLGALRTDAIQRQRDGRGRL